MIIQALAIYVVLFFVYLGLLTLRASYYKNRDRGMSFQRLIGYPFYILFYPLMVVGLVVIDDNGPRQAIRYLNQCIRDLSGNRRRKSPEEVLHAVAGIVDSQDSKKVEEDDRGK